MSVALQALTQNADPKLVAGQLALFKAGQILQALVVGQAGSGLTQLQIGDVLIEAQLPQPAQPGTTLQLQVKTGGSAPQLALLSQQPPAVVLPEVARVPLPVQVASVMLPEVEPPAMTVPVPAGQEQPQASPGVVQPQLQASAPVQVGPQQRVPGPQVVVPQVAAEIPEQVIAAPLAPGPGQAQTPQGQPSIVPQAQVVTPPTSQIDSISPAPVVVAQGSVPAAPEAAAQITSQQQTPITPAAQQSAPLVEQQAPPPAAPAPPQAVPSPAAPQPAVSPQPAAVTANAAPGIAQHAAPQTAVPAVSQNAVVTAPVPDVPEAVSASPLLVAQAAPKVQQTVADLPKMAPAPAQAAPVAPQPLPATPEQAVAQMAPEAMAKQNSVAPLLQSLAAVIAKPGLLPEPIIKAALQVLAQRIVTPDGKVQTGEIEKAVARSGVFLEAALASAAPVRGDAKAALLNLRTMLEEFLGGAPAASPPAQRESPPLRGLPPRAMAMEAPPLPDAPRDVARVLHGQTDAAISRVKLGQLAGLPDAPNTPRAAQPELRIELPFLIGHELVMAQLQIAQDGRREPNTRRRGWTMRFAMNFSQTGEVGAEVGLLGRSVNVALWAAEPETAAAMNAALPELARALESLGLDPGPVRIRSAVPESPRIASGHFVDAMT